MLDSILDEVDGLRYITPESIQESLETEAGKDNNERMESLKNEIENLKADKEGLLNRIERRALEVGELRNSLGSIKRLVLSLGGEKQLELMAGEEEGNEESKRTVRYAPVIDE